MNIKFIEINKDMLDDITFNYLNILIKNLENNDAIISGGFARFIASKIFKFNISENIKCIYDYFKYSGDIDIFLHKKNVNIKKIIYNLFLDLNNSNKENKTYNSLENLNNHIFETLFAKNILYKNKYFNIKFQFIDFVNFNSIEQLFYTFDIENCKYALSINNKKINLIYSNEALHSDLKHIVTLCDSEKNELFAKRIYKYTMLRGCHNGINEKSKNIFNDFLQIPLYNNWDEDKLKQIYKTAINKNSIEYYKDFNSFNSMNYLIKSKCFNKDNLSLLLLFSNRWKTTIYTNYQYINYDWANSAIQNLI